MAETKVQPASSEKGSAARRGEYLPSRDLFSPFSIMRRFSEEMDRLFTNPFGFSRSLGSWGSWTPPLELRERDGNLEILAELPGMTKEDVKVECSQEGITIEGEKKQEMEKEEGGIHRSERFYGHFQRTIPMPEGAEIEKAKAEFKDGVLQVRVPLSEQARSKRRQIPIST